MRLCFVTDSHPLSPPFGGMAVYTQTASRALAARGHEVHVIVATRGASHDALDGEVRIHFRRVNWLPLVGKFVPTLGESCWIAAALRVLHKEHHFDLVEFANFEGVGLVSELLAIAPSVVRLHTSMAEMVELQQRPSTWGERFMMWAERQSARRARGVVTHSRAHRERLGNLYGLSRIEFIPHGIPIPPSRAVEPGQPHVLSLGRLTTRKGGKTLLAAIPLILAAHPGTRFTIVGAGDDHPLVRDFRAAHPAIGGVQFIEFASGEDLEALYSVATVYASASVYESFGLTFVEAQARNIPVVGCATSAMNEIIVDRETGLLVAPSDPQSLADAVVRLLGDPALRERLGREGRRIAVEQYSADRMAGDIDAWYRRVLNR